MLNIDLRKIYNFYPVEPAPDAANLPTGGDIYYECLDCTTVINSVPHIKSACPCGNLTGGGNESGPEGNQFAQQQGPAQKKAGQRQ